MAATPAWLYYLLGASMLVVAGYCVALLALGIASRRTDGWDVELSHVAMGLAMAGMFVDGWAFGRRGIWEGVFGALLVLFVVRAGRSIRAHGLHLPHTAVHALMSFAMLVMYWYPMQMGLGSTVPAAPAGGAVAKPDPSLVLVLAVLFLASAVGTLTTDHRGAAVVGTHCMPASARTGPPRPLRGRLAGAAAVVEVDGALRRPRLLDASHIVMCVAMAFMLVLMV